MALTMMISVVNSQLTVNSSSESSNFCDLCFITKTPIYPWISSSIRGFHWTWYPSIWNRAMERHFPLSRSLLAYSWI